MTEVQKHILSSLLLQIAREAKSGKVISFDIKVEHSPGKVTTYGFKKATPKVSFPIYPGL